MDALPPPPPTTPPAYVYAATDIHPRTDEERKLCERASSVDWLYLGVLALSNVGSIYLDGNVFKGRLNAPEVRTIGPAIVGLTWGATLGSIYPSLPKCNTNWVRYAPPEGDVRSSLPFAFSMALLAGITAPILVGVETGPLYEQWSTSERVSRVIVSGITGFLSAFLPYWKPISPRPWRAALDLTNIRAWGDDKGAYFGYGFRF